MSKISLQTFENFKAIDRLTVDFKGCSAILMAGNNKGKTSFLRGLIDRIRFVRPDVIVKEGREEGFGEMVLDSGEKFLWEFDKNGFDKLTYKTKEGAKKSVTRELGNRFFPPIFDIDKFLQSTPKEQTKQLQKIVGMDFTEIDARYQKAYDDRTAKNFESEKFHVKLSTMLQVPKVDPVDLTALTKEKELEKARLKSLYESNQAHNAKLRKEWTEKCDALRAEINEFNSANARQRGRVAKGIGLWNELKDLGYAGEDVQTWLDTIQSKIQKDRAYEPIPEPQYINELPNDKILQDIDAKILAASEINTKAKAYSDYVAYAAQVAQAKGEAEAADILVKEIEAERKSMIERCKFPKGIEIRPDGIYVDNLPFNRDQISTSKLYTTALRIASMNIGEVRTLYFDASFLDKNSLNEIEAWAHENDLQLLIERPDFEGGEITYELIENKAA